MNLESILTRDRTLIDFIATSRKRALQLIAETMSTAVPGLTPTELFDALIARERLGSTALGNGIAIPHCRLSKCSQTLAGLFRTVQPIDFDAVDRLPVELLFVLLVPESNPDEHVRTLGLLAARLENPSYVESLLAAESNEALYVSAMRDPESKTSATA